ARTPAWSRRWPAILTDSDEAANQLFANGHRERGFALPPQLRVDQLQSAPLCSLSRTQLERSRHSRRSEQCRGRGLEATVGLDCRPFRPETYLPRRDQSTQLSVAFLGL